MNQWIASSEFFVCGPGSNPGKTTIRIGLPEKDPEPDGDQRCRVEFSQLGESDFVYGIDTLQALCLAILYLRQQVEKLEGEGYRFCHEKDDEESVHLLFTHFGDISKAPWIHPED